MAHDIFISYTTKESDVALAFCDQAEKAGIKCWIAERDIPFGGAYDELIPEAIENARWVVFLISELSMQSEDVAKELKLAIDNNSRNIVPVLIQDVRLVKSFKYHLSRPQYIKALDEDIQVRFISAIKWLQSLLRGPLPEAFKTEEAKSNNNLASKEKIQLVNEFDFFTLGKMTAKQVLEGDPVWIDDIEALEEKDKSYVLRILKESPDNTILELMPEYYRYLHDINTYDYNVKTIQSRYLIGGLANLLNLSIEEVKSRVSNDRANIKVKHIFREKWPNYDYGMDDDCADSLDDGSYVDLGNRKVKDILGKTSTIYLIHLYTDISEATIIRQLKKASPNEIINNAIKNYDKYLDPHVLGIQTVSFVRKMMIDDAVVEVINNIKITFQKVEERLNGANGNVLIKDLFFDVWPS